MLLYLGCAMAAVADEPTPEVPWFDIDFTQPWQDSNGVWSVPSGPDCACEWTAASSRLDFEGVTNSTVAFRPTAGTDERIVSVEASFTLVDQSVMRTIPAIPGGDVRGAITVLQKADWSLAYMGWTAHGWVELAGATPAIGIPAVMRICYDDMVTPPRVSYCIDGQFMVAATNAAESSFETIDTRADMRVELYGAGAVSSLSGTCELPERQAAVVQRDGSFAYHADIAGACEVATNGAEVVLLRQVQEMDWAATSNGTPLRLAGRLAKSREPIFTLADETPPGARLPLGMPPGEAVDCVLFSPFDAAAMDAVHVHGDPGTVYTLYPSSAGARIVSGQVPLDPGGFTGFLSVPDGCHAFVGGLQGSDLGSLESLYIQGDAVTLCGTNTYSGATVVESGTLELCGVLTRSSVQVWGHGGYVGAPVTGGVFSVEGYARVDAPLTGGSVTLADGASVAFELETAENGMILVPRSALPAGGNVSVSVAVDGRFVATTRTVLSGDVVAAVAGAPELAATGEAFTLADDRVSAVIANAVAGFWYHWEASDNLAGPFVKVGDSVCAQFDGTLSVSLEEQRHPQRFYRLCVTAEP